MLWIIMRDASMWLLMLIFAVSYILFQRKIVGLFKALAREKEGLASQAKGVELISRINLASFFLIVAVILYGIVTSLIEYSQVYSRF